MLESRLVGLLLVPAEKDLADGVPAADEIVVADGYVLHSLDVSEVSWNFFEFICQLTSMYTCY